MPKIRRDANGVPMTDNPYYAQSRAQRLVREAVKNGSMPEAATLLCTDCGNWAKVYDHRKYSEPLNVEPVCVSCNCKRGPAEDSLVMLSFRRKLQQPPAHLPAGDSTGAVTD